MISGFPPICDTHAKILILGSMPSITSLEKQEYYGFAHNRFWKFMARYFSLSFQNYEEKRMCLLKHHIALWDVIATCEREGSLDSAIRNAEVNDIAAFLKEHPSIEVILCNGKKSYELYTRYFSNLSIKVYSLPSTSNANRSIKEEDLYEKWKIVFDEYL